jgi:TolB protein
MKSNARINPRLILLILAFLVFLNLSALYWLGWPILRERGFNLPALGPAPAIDTAAASQTPSPSPTATYLPGTPTVTPVPVQVDNPHAFEELKTQGVLLLSLRDGDAVHLFAFHPDLLSLTRITHTSWDEIQPSLSPDGTLLAYSSRQNGYWDLFTLDLQTGKATRITDTPDYEGSPTWSPDGQWLAYEMYHNDALNIWLRSLADNTQAPIQLTEDTTASSSPAWSPRGRQIAFVSSRSGHPEIWLADLDKSDGRFTNISATPQANASHPVWSKDGRWLAWSSEEDGSRHLMIWDSENPQTPPSQAGFGDWPAWSPSGDILFTTLHGPNQAGLAAYLVSTGLLRMTQMNLPGEVYGLTWKSGPLSGWLLDSVNRADTAPHPPLVELSALASAGEPNGRQTMAKLDDISAPIPMIHEAVYPAFQALRLRSATDSGWDVLSSLENAYVPLTTPYEPSLQDDWLFTGRAFALNPLIQSAGWMTAVREDLNGQTYWRVFLKARFQDGSAGIPLSVPAWDMNSRFAGDPRAYENGGQLGAVPSGYWIDLTEMAMRYGWERLPSRPNWRTFYPGIRFNQFVIRSGLDWHTAMSQIYPAEALATPTSMPTATYTPTYTLVPSVATPTRTIAPTITLTPTRRPTLTLNAAP